MFEIENNRPFTINELARCLVDNRRVYTRDDPKTARIDFTDAPIPAYRFLSQMQDSTSKRKDMGTIASRLGKLSAYELGFSNPDYVYYMRHNPIDNTKVLGATEEYHRCLSGLLDRSCREQPRGVIIQSREYLKRKLPEVLHSYMLLWPIKQRKATTDKKTPLVMSMDDLFELGFEDDGADEMVSDTSGVSYRVDWKRDRNKTEAYLVKPACEYVEKWFAEYFRTHRL